MIHTCHSLVKDQIISFFTPSEWPLPDVIPLKVLVHFPLLATRTTLPLLQASQLKQMWWFVEEGRRNKQEYKMWTLSSNIHWRWRQQDRPCLFKWWRSSCTIYYAHLLCHISVVCLIFLILRDLFTQQLSSTELQYYYYVLPINISYKTSQGAKHSPHKY